MQNNKSNGSCASVTRGFAVLCAMLAMGLGAMASPAAAAPFAYVTIQATSNPDVVCVSTVSVIDTGANPPAVVATIPVGSFFEGCPEGVAVTPDGKLAYVAIALDNSVSVIDTARNKEVKTVPVGTGPFGVAVTRDGTKVYVTNNVSNNVSVIKTATHTVVKTVPVGSIPEGIAVTLDGTKVYVTNSGSNNVSVIARPGNTVVATIPVGHKPLGVAITPIAITPDGKHAYVVNAGGNTVSVIATATNTVVGPPITVGSFPVGIAITPDGKHAYVANEALSPNVGAVSVIDTATNMVVATVPMDGNPRAIGIVPPPPGVPFLAFNALLAIQFGGTPNQDAFGFGSNFILSSAAPAINPLTEPVTLQVGRFAITIPIGSFVKQTDGSFFFAGVVNGVSLEALIKPTGTLRYAFQAKATGANLTGTVNTVYATLIIGGDSGATSVTATISH